MKINHKIIYLLIFVLLFVLIFILRKIKEGFTNESVIPLHIYQTWHEDKLHSKMQECVNSLKEQNPEFEHHLYNVDMCRDFIKNNFDKDVVCAFDNLIPGAYKADLWRYCILYKNGGIYLDIKFKCDNNFKMIELTDKEYFVRDLESSGGGVCNGFIVCKPNNEKLYSCIQQIVKNVNNQNYGDNTLHPTGPMLFKKYFTQIELDNIDLNLSVSGDIQEINKDNVVILSSYPEYRNELKKNNVTHYSDLWKNREIYGDKKCFN